ncbi:unnamed protein product [Oikopleura dioica]|uniref:Uncharacterized protein n=1 Tax=Oikopleura dioica TaxID=34765 RepID=E4YKU0_OIKDI|nr:unnamed protein product [Oikopleura dioica]
MKFTAEFEATFIFALEVFLAKILVRVILAALLSVNSTRSPSQLVSSNADRTFFKASCHLEKDAAERAFLAFTRI